MVYMCIHDLLVVVITLPHMTEFGGQMQMQLAMNRIPSV